MQINDTARVRKRQATCSQCGAGFWIAKRGGRPRLFCSDRCRDRARRDREFKAGYSTFVTGGYPSSALPRKSENSPTISTTCKGDFADRPPVDPTLWAYVVEIETAARWSGGRKVTSADGVVAYVMRAAT